MHFITKMYLLAYLLSLSASLETGLNLPKSMNTTMPSLSTELNPTSQRNITYNVDDVEDIISDVSKSTYLEKILREGHIQKQFRKKQNRRSERKKNRTRKQKELTNATISHFVEKTKDDGTVSQSSLYESKIVQHNGVTSTTSKNMKQLDGIDSTPRNAQVMIQNKTTAGSFRITRRPMRWTMAQTTESPVRWETQSAKVLKTKSESEGRSKNRPQRNYRTKPYASTPQNTLVTIQNKTTSGSFFKLTPRPTGWAVTQTTESPIRKETQSVKLLDNKAASEGRSKNRPQRNHRKKPYDSIKHHHRISSIISRHKHKDKKLNSKGKKRVESLQDVTRVGKPSGGEKETLLDKDGGPTKEECPTCGKAGLFEEHVRQIRLDMFIKTMAEKLRMTPEELMARPNKRLVPRFPRELLEATLQDNAMQKRSDQFYAKDQKIILPGRDLGRTCIAKRSSGCYSFNLAGNIKGDVATAELWVYKTPDRNDTGVQTFVLYGLERLRSGKVLARNQIQRHYSYVREGWVVINITRTVSSWVEKRKSIEMIAIRCATCVTRNHKALYGTKYGYTPLVIIKYDTTSLQHRYRRSYDDNCNPEYECCKRRLSVNFRDIHMHSVVAPPDLPVGYCYGTCDQITNYTHNHTMIKQRVRIRSDNTTEELRERLKPCCVPITLKPAMFMLGYPRAGTISKMPNAIVDQCGCV